MNLLLSWLPNALSISRLLLGFAFPWIPESARVPVVIYAGLSDLLDGAAGRWLGVTSKTGQMLDPIADKGFVAAVVVTFWLESHVSTRELFAIGARDIVVTLGLLWLLLVGPHKLFAELRPRWLGKCATAAQFIWLAGVLFEKSWLPVWLFRITAMFSVLAAIDYSVFYYQERRKFLKEQSLETKSGEKARPD